MTDNGGRKRQLGALTSTDSGRTITRRKALLGTAAFATFGVGNLATPALATGEYGDTVDLVDDFGADPTGEEPINDALAEAVQDDTKVVFPPGEYWIDGSGFSRSGLSHTALVGGGDQPGDVTVRPTEGTNPYVFILRGDGIRIENMTIDESAPMTSTGINVLSDDNLVLRNLHFDGPGDGPAEPVGSPGEVEVAGPFNIVPGVRNADGTGLIEDVHCPEVTVPYYRKGAMWVAAGSHAGHLLIRRSSFGYSSDNAIYGSGAGAPWGAGGSIGVENCYFENNNVTAVRLGTAGSYAKNCTVVVDGDGPPILPWGGLASRAGWVWYGFDGEYRNFDVIIDHESGHGFYGHPSQTGKWSIKNSRVRADQAGVAVFTPPGDGIGIKNVSVTGDTDFWGTMVIQRDADVQNCCIRHTEGARNGIIAQQEAAVTVSNSLIDVPGDAIVEVGDAEVEVINPRIDGDCAPAQRRHAFDR